MFESKSLKDIENEYLKTIGVPNSFYGSKVIVKGKNNLIKIDENVKLLNTTIKMVGDDNFLWVKNGCVLRGGFLLDKGAKIVIGERTIFNFDSAVVEARDSHNITIGRDCLFSHFRMQTSDVHSIFDLTTKKRINHPKHIIIGNNVWIAYDAFLLKGTQIDNGSVVGARAVVSGSVPSNCIVAGNPAKIIKTNIAWDTRSLDLMPSN